MRVLHLITGLDHGGAETMLVKLLAASGQDADEHIVLVLSSTMNLASAIEERGIHVSSLNIEGVASGLCALWNAAAVVRRFQPNVIMTWLHHADFFGVLLKCLVPSMSLAWNLRCSRLSRGEISTSNLLLVRLLAKLSFLPSIVVANAETGKQAHMDLGYRPRRWRVLPNGFDTSAFSPDPHIRLSIRTSLGIDKEKFLIGIVGRYHPMKDFGLFVAAAGKFAGACDKVRFVMVGRGVTWENTELVDMVTAAGIGSRVLLLGQRDDVPSLMKGLDVLTNTSTSEGFPNVIGEAMACGVPCVATDVGDSAAIVADTGIVIPSGDVGALVAAWQKLTEMSPDEFVSLQQRAREHIVINFEIGVIAQQYQELFHEFA